MLAPIKNWFPLVDHIPMTNNSTTAPQVVVASLDIDLEVGQIVLVTSKIESRVLMTYNTGISGYVQVARPTGEVTEVTAITRAMGYNTHVNNSKYNISHHVGFYVATEAGAHTFGHLLWAYSSAYKTGDIVGVMYCDQQLAIVGELTV